MFQSLSIPFLVPWDPGEFIQSLLLLDRFGDSNPANQSMHRTCTIANSKKRVDQTDNNYVRIIAGFHTLNKGGPFNLGYFSPNLGNCFLTCLFRLFCFLRFFSKGAFVSFVSFPTLLFPRGVCFVCFVCFLSYASFLNGCLFRLFRTFRLIPFLRSFPFLRFSLLVLWFSLLFLWFSLLVLWFSLLFLWFSLLFL